MASPEKRTPRSDDRSVTRTYRAAVRLGEDFITLEETITLPIDATDDEVTQAVDLGWRIYRAQKAAVEAQVGSVRETGAAQAAPIVVRDPDSPASDKQRNYIAALQDDLTWSAEQLASYAEEQQIDLVTMTKGQASGFIDGLKKLAEDRGEYEPRQKAEPAPAAVQQRMPDGASNGAPANERQIHALQRIAQQHGLDLEAETRRRHQVAPQGLSAAQASALLREWQQRPAPRRQPESAL